MTVYDLVFPYAATSSTIFNSGPSINVKDATYGALGDGSTDDTTALLLAYADALESGLSVYVPAGTYIVRPNQHSIDGGGDVFHLYADGAVFKASTAGPTGSPGDDRPIFHIQNVADVKIEGLEIDGYRSVVGSADWTNYLHCLMIEDTDRCEISRCQFTSSPSIGLYLRDCTNTYVHDCESTDCMYHGYHALRCDRQIWLRNRFIGIGNQSTNTAVGGIGLLITKGSHAHIEKCYISQSSDTGTKTEGCAHVTYLDNYVEECGKDGIKVMAYAGFVTSIEGAKVIGNTVRNLRYWRSDGSGLINIHDVIGCQVIGNNVSGGLSTGTEVGIRAAPVSGTTSYTTNLVIADNIVGTTVNEGIFVNYPADVLINGNRTGKHILASNVPGQVIIENNTIQPTVALAATSGIQVLYPVSTRVSRNVISNVSNGILIQPGVSTTTIRATENNCFDIDGRAIEIKTFSAISATNTYTEMSRNIGSNIGRNSIADYAFSISTDNVTLGELVMLDNHLVSAGGSGVTTFLAVKGSGTAAPLATIAGNTCPSSITTGVDYYTKITRTLGTPTGDTAPASGTWVRGDVVWNLFPADGEGIAFQCLTSGTPGTWAPCGISNLLTRSNTWSSQQVFQSATFSSTIVATRSATTNSTYGTKVSGDAVNRLDVLADGTLKWSDGTNPADATLTHITGGLSLLDGMNLAVSSGTGTKIGTSVQHKLGFWNVTPVVQPTAATQVAPAAYATGAFGLDSNAHMQALYDLVVAMRTALVAVGIIKGS